MTQDTPRLRLGVLAIVALSLFAALFTRLWYLQVLSAPDFQVRAQANLIRTVLEPAPRGRILDRQGRVLVGNRAANIVAVDRSLLGDDEDDEAELLGRLSGVLGIPVEVLQERLDSKKVSPYTPVPVAGDKEPVSDQQMTTLLERADEFPSVVAKRVAVRTYPQGNLAAHILGYILEVNDTDLQEHPGEYELGDQIGRAGVEKYFERDLRGTKGELKIEVDAKGKPIRVVDHKLPVQGNDVVLSIDIDVQRTAEQALAQGLESTRGKPFEEDDNRPLVADAGAAVVLDTKGTVEALASYPTFDLPAIADGMNEAEAGYLFPQGEEAKKRAAPNVNRAISGLYAPGSTWKLVTADAALRKNLITPNFSLVDGGTYTIRGDCSGRGCIKRNAGSKAWGRVGVVRALSVSSDVFFYDIGARFWQERERYGKQAIQDSAFLYGFGQQTGVPLPAESGGRVLTPDMKEQLAAEGSPLVDGANWYTGQNTNLAIGQEAMVVTPIQLANAYATFANGGNRYFPNIALRTQRPDGTVVRELQPRLDEHIDIPPSIHEPILQGLRDVIDDEEGTANNAFQGFPLASWGVAGKTGTAQNGKKQDTALFAAFGPTQDPQHVVTVVMEQSGFGASAAAPVARKIFDQLAGVADPNARVEFTPVNGVGD